MSEDQFAVILSAITSLDHKIDSFDARFQYLNARFDAFEERMEARLQSREENMEAKLHSFEERIDLKLFSMESRMNERFDITDKRLGVLEKNWMSLKVS